MTKKTMILAFDDRKNFFLPGGDHLTLMNVYNQVSTQIKLFFSSLVTTRPSKLESLSLASLSS